MAFLETPRFPEDISYGSRGGPMYQTQVVRVDSGHEKRLSRWAYPLHQYDISYGITRQADAYNVTVFFHAVAGRLHGFRFKDPHDFQSNHDMSTPVSDTDQILGTGDGVETDFQLIKTYTRGALSLVRAITKPVVSTTVVSLDDVSQPTGWSLDTTIGILTFSTPPALGVVVKAGFQNDVAVRFDSDILEIQWEDSGLQSTSVIITEIRQ